jgi:hypothetical protein
VGRSHTVRLSFPDGAVGRLSWLGGEQVASDIVVVPDNAELSLEVRGAGPPPGSPVDLRFLRRLPPDSIRALHLRRRIVPSSMGALPHLALGLLQLTLGWTDFDDEVLTHVAQLDLLAHLQTWGNRFTDEGVQRLSALRNLESLYLEDEGLTPAALRFVGELPRLAFVGMDHSVMPVEDQRLLQSRLRGHPGWRRR